MYRITLYNKLGRTIVYAWGSSEAEVRGELVVMIDLCTEIKVEPLKWWQWK